MRALVAAAENPVLPESAELLGGLFACAVLLVPVVVVAFVVRQVVMARRAAHADAEAPDGRTAVAGRR